MKFGTLSGLPLHAAVLRSVGLGCGVMSLHQMLDPHRAITLMLNSTHQLPDGKDLLTLKAICRWSGFFFLGLSSTTLWASYQPLSNIRGLLRIMAGLWLWDASFIKWTVFRNSGVMNVFSWAIAGSIDSIVGLTCLALSFHRPHSSASSQDSAAKTGWTAWSADNRANWDDRVAGHAQDPNSGYAQEIAALRNGGLALQPIDIAQFGDAVADKSLLHLMCHIGTDTLGWLSYGASRVVGIDFSEKALEEARILAKAVTTKEDAATFICCDVYDTEAALSANGQVPLQYDCVFTSVGVLTWINDIQRWASTVATCLKPGGQFYIRDGHPMIYALEYEDDELFAARPIDKHGGRELVLAHPYFETKEPETCYNECSYTGSSQLQACVTHEWNHSLGEIVTALITAGLKIEYLREHRELDWRSSDTMFKENGGDDTRFGGWQMPKHQQDIIPLMFSIRATKI